MRVLVTGQVGLDKKEYLNQVAQLARQHGEGLKIFHLGDMMYREAPDVPPGRILDLPLARLNSLRRAVMRDVLAEAPKHKHVLVNTHATFRWRHGLSQILALDPIELEPVGMNERRARMGDRPAGNEGLDHV